MKKSIKRWLALLLAVAMIVTSGAFTNLTYLRATDGEETVEAQVEEPKAETQEKEKEKTEKVTVEQAEPEQPAPEAKEEKKEETAPREEASKEETKEEPSNKEETPSEEVKEEPAKEEQDTVSEEKTEESAPAASEGTATVDAQGEKTEKTAEAPAADEPDIIEADPIEETDTETEEVKYPAVSFEEKASNGVKVKVEAPEGAFPEGTTIKVKAVSDEKAMSVYEQTLPEDQKAVDAKGVDITFYNAEGEEIQPKKEIKVSLKCEALEGENFSVVHEKDSGDVEVVTEDATATGATFGATSFSVWTIGSSETIYEGTQDDATVEEENAVVVTIKVQTEDGTPIKQDSKTVYKEDGEESFDFSYSLDALDAGYYYSLTADTSDAFTLEGTALTASFTEAGTVTVTVIQVAQEVDYTIKVREESLDNPDEMTEVSSTTETGKVGEMTDVVPDEREGFSASVDQQVIAASGTVVYVDYTRNTYFLTYNTNGGSYVQSKSGVYGATVKVYDGEDAVEGSETLICGKEEHRHNNSCYEWSWSEWENILTCGKEVHSHTNACYSIVEAKDPTYDPAPVRQGYTFGGWYADTDCTQVADKEITLSGNVTVYAKWIPNKVNYTVVYFQEVWNNSTNSSYYAYKESDTKQAEVGSTVTGTNDKNYSYYTFKSGSSETVKADGSTVVKVYYDLTRYTLVFNLNKSGAYITVSGDSKQYTGSEYKITNVVLGQDIADKWPSLDTSGKVVIHEPSSGSNRYFEIWGGSYASKRFEVTADMLSSNGNNQTVSGTTVTYRASWRSSNGTVDVEYWLQSADGTTYVKSDIYSQTKVPADDLSAKTLYGYTHVSTPNGYKGTSGSTYRFYYDRVKYSISYYYKDSLLRQEKEIRFGVDINTDDYTSAPKKPSEVDSEATFGGWYDNAECTGSPYVFSTMPANDLVLYANWVVPSKTVTVVYYEGAANGSITVPKGSYIEDLPNPTRDGYEFAGWFDENGEDFDINAPVMQDVTIYAHWTEKTTVSYIVRYVCDGTEISSETKYGKVGSTVSAKAALPAGYDASEYVVAPARANLTLTRAESENVITFTVTKLSDLKYSVEYKYNGNFVLEGSTPITDAAEYTASSTTMRVYPNSGIVQRLNKLGYKLNETYITLNYTGEQKKLVATFTLSPKTYTITYTGMEGASWEADANHPETYTTVDGPIRISNPVKTGYEFTGWEIDGTNTKKISGTHDGMNVVIGKGSVGNLTFNATWKIKQYPYTVKYYLNNTTTELKEQYDGPATDYGTTIPVSAAAIEGYHLADGQTTPRMLTIGTGKNEVIFYYSPNTYSYTVNYLSKVDGSAVKPAKVATALFGDKVTETAATADGYTLADASSQTIDITTGTNVINFYYYKNTTLTANSAEKEYNGTTQSVSGYYVTETTAEVVLEGISAGASGVDAGEYTATFAGDPTGKVIDDKYYVTGTVNGLLTITAKSTPIIIRAASDSKTYDGIALVNSRYTYTQGILVDGDVLTANVSGSQINAGSSDNVVISHKVMRGETDVTANYTFGAYEKGTLTVNKRAITLTSGSAEKVYNGTPLTKKTVDVTTGSFVTGEGATYDVTGSRTDVGTSDNVFEYTLNDGTNADNYDITTVYGKLTVKKSEETIIITAPDGSKKYDGTALKVSKGATYTGTIAETDTLLVVLSGSQTDVGSSANTVASYRVVRGEKDVTENYTFGESVSGTLTVTPRTVTLTSATQSKTYDGTALTNGKVEVSGDGFISGEGATYDVTGSQLDAGTSKNTFTYTLNSNTKAGNYAINKVEGDLTVNPITTKIVITADSDSKTYDGTALTDDGYTYTQGVLVSGDVLTAVVSGSQKDAGSSANVVSSYKVMRGGKDVTANYTFGTSVDGTLTVNKRSVTLTSASDEKVYNGTALTNDTVTVGGYKFVTGEGATYTVSGSQLDAGTSKNTFTYTLNSDTKADNYEITKVEGDLTVTAITTPIVVKANSNSKTYDGTALTDSGYTYTPNVLVTGDTLTAVVEGSRTDAGVSDNVVTSYKVMRDTTDVTANYTFGTSEKGTLTVNKREVTLTSGSGSKVYDGTALTNSTVTESGDGFANGEGATYNVTGSRTNFGSSKNTFTYTLNDNTKADNYTITTVEGDLTVRKSDKTIVITANSKSKTYDGTPLTDSGYTYTQGVLVPGDELTAVVEGSQTDVGTGENVVTSYKVMRGTEDVTGNYEFGDCVDGTLTVNKRSVTLTSATDSKTYNGTPLTNHNVAVTGEGFASGEGATYTVTGSRLDAGTSKNTFTYTLNSNTKAGNYDITTVEGDLTVNRIATEIVITADSESKMYDGSPLTDSGYSFTQGVLVSGDVLTAVVSGSRTDAGTAANVVTSYKVMRGETDVTANYSFGTSVDGTLTVTKRNVTLTSATDSKTYDGTVLTNDTVTEGGNGFVTDEGATYTVTGSQLDAGSSANTFTYALNEGTNAANYDITVVEGTLTVNKITTPIVITADSDEKVYDGTPLTKKRVTYTPNVLIAGDVLKPVVSGSQTNAGSSANVVTSYSVMRGDVDVTKNYTFGDCIDGTLTVTKRPVTLTSGSSNKAYDGKPLTNSTVTVGGQGFVAGQGATYTVTGSRIDVGTSDNTFTYSLNDGTNAANYDITSIEGKLTVTEKTDTIIITAPSESKVYDGQPLTLNAGATYNKGTLAEGDRLYVVLGGSQTDAGTSACTVESYRIVRGEGEDEKDVTSYYTGIQTVDGELKVTPRPVTLTSATDRKTYDGKPLTNSKITVGGEGFASGEGATYTVTGSQLDKGTSTNTFSYQLNTGTKAENYTITKFEGTLTVVPIGGEGKTITITADSDKKVYDGTALTDNGFTYTENILVKGDILTATVEGSLTNVGTTANRVTSYQVMRGTTDVTENYTFNTSVDGTLEVTRRPVTLTSGSAEKVFDTAALTNAEITVGGEGFVKDEGATYNVTGSQTLVGFSENEFEYTLKTGTDAENYEITKAYGILRVTDGSVTKPVDPSKVISKTHPNKDDNTRYNLGETVTFTITVMNIYAEPKTITLTEQGGVALTKSEFENVQPGATVSTTATYVITEDDILKGKYNNTVKASFTGGQSYEATDTVDPEDNNPNLTVNKTVVGKTEGYKLGEKITYNISVTNNGNVTIKDVKVTDSLTGDVLSFGDIAPRTETKSQSVKYTVTEANILEGKVANVATVTSGQDDNGKEPDSTPGKATVDTEDVNAHLKVNKREVSQAPVGGYKLGDVITYKISVTNDGNVTIKGVKVYDDLTGQTLDFGDIAANPEGNVTTAEQEVTYTVKEADILRGYVKNTATIAAGKDPNNNTPGSEPGSVTVDTDDIHAKLVVNKKTTSTAPDNGYGVGDTITYEISVTNTGNVTIKGVVVTDILTGQTHSFDDIAPNKEGNATTDVWTVSYTVTEADVSKGKVVNEAVVTEGKDPKDNDPEKEPGKTTDTTEEKNSHLTITKTTTSRMPEGGYKLGDTITYSIEVVNDGNQTLNNVVVSDTITGDTWTIGTMSIGAKETYTASYTVTEADIRNGKVVNEAVMTSGTDPDGEDPTVDPGETEDPTVPKNSHLTLTKTVTSEPAEGDAYALGETITYAIVATNDGNQTLTNVKVVDELTGDAWTIASIAPGQSSTVMETSYTVKEEDILNGSVKNVATVTEATDPDEEEPEVTPGEEEVPTEQQNPSLFIKKVADQRANLQEGDIVTYTITVVNNGNVTIDNIVVKDELTGDTFDKNVFNLIGTISLKPGESRDFTVKYTVTQADLINGTIKNVANVTGTDPNGDTIDESAEETVETEKANAAYTVDKAIVDPKLEYNVGDTINYTIKVTNTGNLTLNNLVVTDQMQGAAGNAVISDQAGITVDGNKATIATLKPGTSITLKVAYTVTREDADGTISNKVTVNSGSKPGTDPEDPKAPGTPEGGDETDPKPIEKTYLLTIHYVDNDGNVVAPDYTARLLAGETMDAVVSPAVDGYTPDYGTVALPATGMPAQDVTVTVVYTANAAILPVNPPQPNQPNDDNDNGGGQVVNNNDAAPAADDAPAPEPQAPADGVIEPTDDGGYDLTPVEEPQTPLGNMDLDDHTCCILHFLIMLLTLIIFALYTKSRKNRQMKVAELKEQLAIATIQKELGLSDEEMAKYLEEAKNLANADKQANA